MDPKLASSEQASMREFQAGRKSSEVEGEDLEVFPLNLAASPSPLEFSHTRCSLLAVTDLGIFET